MGMEYIVDGDYIEYKTDGNYSYIEYTTDGDGIYSGWRLYRIYNG
jgi:hypothetical protein